MTWKPKTGDLVAFHRGGGTCFGVVFYASPEDWFVDWGHAYPRSLPRDFSHDVLPRWREIYENLLLQQKVWYSK